MRIFIYEYLCGPAGRDGAASLRREGWAMLAAVLEDLGACGELQITTLVSDNMPPADWRRPANLHIERSAPKDEGLTFRRLAGAADFSWIIAPEFDNLLYERCRWTEEVGGRLLGPSSQAVRLTADKWELARHLRCHGVPTPPTELWPTAQFLYPIVCKPRDGAGSQATFLVRDAAEAQTVAERALREGWTGPLIAQPCLPGIAASVAFLIGPKQRLALPAAEQLLSEDGRFHYLGGRLPLAPELDRRARALAERAIAAVDGMFGYAGVDLILGAAPDGSEDAVIEINPRLTTSYVGLRRLTGGNLAQALLEIVQGAASTPLTWRNGGVCFGVDDRGV